ncbi:MAG TPA: M12 family metallo-peptidase [Thermoanaerobaculia bacterium]|nr:M12 family metallo-peptidase [Thermoanaerobaculia bacterium]
MLHSLARRLRSRRSPALLAIFVLGLAVAAPAAAAPPSEPILTLVAAPIPGEAIEAANGAAAEVFTFADGLAATLAATRLDQPIRIQAFPVGPTERADVIVSRHDVYAPDAKIYAVEGGTRREVPRSRWVFFQGEAEGDGDLRVFLAIDPDAGAIRGFAHGPRGTYDFQPYPDAGLSRTLIAPPEFFEVAAGKDRPSWSCGAEEGAAFLAPPRAGSEGGQNKAITALHQITVAVDTDNEFMAIKACTSPGVNCNNATVATNYLASLVAAMSAIYERDLLVRLVEGTTILRVSTTADPYAQNSNGNASSNELSEFSNYWSANQGGVSRGLAMMISGKQPQSNAASGIAWISGLCSTNVGYSFSKVFGPAFAVSNDAKLVGHELGHNFGSPHTHCYNPPIDNCFNGEGGCYSGATSCPVAATINGVTNVRGTIMSYCHLLGGCTASSVFHPASIALIAPIVQSKVNVCIFPVATGPAVAAVAPKSGPAAGGTTVTITGTGFLAGATVTVGGAAATSVVVLGPTTITAVTPARPTGKAAVQVTNPGGSPVTLNDAFFYMPADAPRSFFTVSPCRVLDTRNAGAGGALASLSTRLVQVTGLCGVPASAKAISANVSVVTAGGGGFFGAFPGNGFPLGTTTISFSAGQTRTNNAMILLATDGTGTVLFQNGAAAAAHLVLDVNGYFQ